MDKFYERLREERKRLNLNQTQFGKLGGVELNAQCAYEGGKRFPDLGYLSAIATAGADVQYIVTGVCSSSLAPPIPQDETALLTAYRNADEPGKAALLAVAKSLAVKK